MNVRVCGCVWVCVRVCTCGGREGKIRLGRPARFLWQRGMRGMIQVYIINVISGKY